MWCHKAFFLNSAFQSENLFMHQCLRFGWCFCFILPYFGAMGICGGYETTSNRQFLREGRKAGARNGGIQHFSWNKLHMNGFIVYSWEIIWDAYAERVHRTINTNHPFTLRYMHKKTETNTENGEPFERTSIFNGRDKVTFIYVYRIWRKVCKTREKKERKKKTSTM